MFQTNQLSAGIKKRTESVYDIWKHASPRKQIVLYLVIYTLLFSAITLCCFASFIELRKSLVWYNDGMSLYIPNLFYYADTVFDHIKQFLTGGGLTMYDFSIGFGGDVTRTYFTPISQFLFALFGDRHLSITYTLMTLFRLYLIGLSFSVFCRYFKKSYFATLLGSLIYVFSGYVFYACTHHSHFSLALILLPLLLLGLEKVLRRESPVLLILVVFYSMWTSYYFLYINSFFMLLYAVLRVFDLYRESRLKHAVQLFFKTCGFYLLGVGMAAVAVLPQLTSFGSSSRDSSALNTESLFYYEDFWLQRVLSRIISPHAAPGFWIKIGVAAIVLLAVVVLFLHRRREHRSLRIALGVMTLFLLIPVFAFVFSGFSTIQNRWTYGYTFLLALIVVCMFQYFDRLSKKQMVLLFLVMGVYSIWCITDINANNRYILAAVVMLLLTVMLLLLLREYRLPAYSRRFKAAFLGLVCVTLMVNGLYTFDVDYGAAVNDFAGIGAVNNAFLRGHTSAANEIEDDGFYRTTLSATSMNDSNASKVHGYKPTSIFNSTLPSSTLNYMIENENADLFDLTFIRGLDNRAMLNTLAAGKYHLADTKKISPLPYGYQEYKTVPTYDRDTVIYENEYALPLGYTYDRYLTREQFDALPAIEKQEAMLQAVVLEETPEERYQQETSLELTAKKIPTTTKMLHDVYPAKDVPVWDQTAKYPAEMRILKGGELPVEAFTTFQENTAIRVNFQGLPNSETYLRIKGAVLDSSLYNAPTSDCLIRSTQLERKVRLIQDNYIYSVGRHDMLINLGYSKKPLKEATFFLPAGTNISIEDFEVYCQPMDNYQTQVQALGKESLQNIVQSTNEVRGDITVSTDKLLCLAIPYGSGWTALVDGVEIPLQKANTMYMALPLTAGAHEIVLRYQTPNLFSSLLVSGVCLLLFLGLVFWRIRLKRKQK